MTQLRTVIKLVRKEARSRQLVHQFSSCVILAEAGNATELGSYVSCVAVNFEATKVTASSYVDPTSSLFFYKKYGERILAVNEFSAHASFWTEFAYA